MQRKKRGSSMGKGTRKSRQMRKSGKNWLKVPKGFSLYKEEPGSKIKIDILPYVVKNVDKHPEKEIISEDVWYRFPYKIHRNIGPGREAILCPTIIGKPCPICEQMQEIYDDPDADNKQASKFRPTKRSLFIIKIKGGDKKNKNKTFIWDMSDYCFFDQVDTELEHGEEEWNDFACLEGGYTLNVRLLEESFDSNKYAMADRIDFIPRNDYDEDIYDENPCLDDMVVDNIKSYKAIEKILEGSADDPQDKEDNKAKSDNSSKSAKKLTWKKLLKMDEDDLIELWDTEEIVLYDEDNDEVEPDDFENEMDLRRAIAQSIDIEIPKEKKKEAKKEKKKKRKSRIECPYAYKFGEGWGDHEECEEDECEKYDECFEKYDELQE